MKRQKRRKKRYQVKGKKEVWRRWGKTKYKKGEVIMTEEKM